MNGARLFARAKYDGNSCVARTVIHSFRGFPSGARRGNFYFLVISRAAGSRRGTVDYAGRLAIQFFGRLFLPSVGSDVSLSRKWPRIFLGDDDSRTREQERSMFLILELLPEVSFALGFSEPREGQCRNAGSYANSLTKLDGALTYGPMQIS